MEPLLLHSIHQSLGAAFVERNGREIVRHYGNPEVEYAAARSASVLVDLSFRDAIRVTGEERLSWFHGVCTNDIKGVPEWGTAYAAIVTVKGAMVADVRAFRRDVDLVLDLEPGTYESVREYLERYLISEDAELHDAHADLAVLGLVGPKSLEALTAAFGPDATPGGRLELEGRGIGVGQALAARSGIDVLIPRPLLPEVWSRLLEAGQRAGLRPSGMDALEAVRVEDGVPRFGQDLLETTIPLEADLAHAIDFQKGCYVGQEVIARATFRGHMNRKLTGLLLGASPAEPRAELRRDGKRIGFITSVVKSPARGEYVALGYVHRDHLAPGTVLEIASGPATATVHTLPFVA
ncbi:MAG TPA: glycine cleavage T C-terminal barrel domain-containing protein [Myxococcaceae bacterium]|nr:glycine cleavage T C-terminal barrel domain-containing protein [Myxococcaceae bacterium]